MSVLLYQGFTVNKASGVMKMMIDRLILKFVLRKYTLMVTGLALQNVICFSLWY